MVGSMAAATIVRLAALSCVSCTHDRSVWRCMLAVLVRMEGKPFAAGAMRECYAMKKLSTFG